MNKDKKVIKVNNGKVKYFPDLKLLVTAPYEQGREVEHEFDVSMTDFYDKYPAPLYFWEYHQQGLITDAEFLNYQIMQQKERMAYHMSCVKQHENNLDELLDKRDDQE